MNRFFCEKNGILWCFGTVFYGGIIIFLMVSLFSYNPTDSSWLYVSSDPHPITNKGGLLGAQFAAILFYFFGGASFLLLLPLLCGLWIMITHRSIKDEWERVCASLYIVLVGAALLATYYMDCAISPYPGGKCGMMMANTLLYYFD